MKALRVMIKTKDASVDMDNALKSASRIKAPYNAAIRLCLKSDRIERALKLVNQMKKDGIFPSAATYTILISGLTQCMSRHRKAASRDGGANANDEDAPEPREVQRVREVFEDLEKLWKQAFPRYFQRTSSGVHSLSAAAKPKDIMSMDKTEFNNLSEQARRNQISQQASIVEARAFPKVLSSALGAYSTFLASAQLKEEQQQLFDRLFPPTQIDKLVKGLSPNASPQDKLELANRKLAEWLPIGDVSTLSTFLAGTSRPDDPDRLSALERVWSRAVKLMELERHERLSKPQVPFQRRHSAEKRALDSSNAQDIVRFVPDEKLMQTILVRLLTVDDEQATLRNRLIFETLSKVYGLDMVSTADGILRDPRLPEHDAESLSHQRYLCGGGDDPNNQPVAEMRDPNTAAIIVRLLANPNTWKHAVAFFNYLWARAHSEHRQHNLRADSVGNMLSNPASLGTTLRPATAVSLLWALGEVGDPVAARTILDAMKQAAASSNHQSQDEEDAGNRRERRSRQPAHQSDSSEAGDWKPADIAYMRVLRANLEAALNEPVGLTASILSDCRDGSEKRKYDAWSETKAVFGDWCDQKASNKNKHYTNARWGAATDDAQPISSSYRKKDRRADDDKLEKMSRIHADRVYALFLHISRTCAKQRGEKGVEVAREALAILDKRIGLESLAIKIKQLQEEVVDRSDLFKNTSAPTQKVYTLAHLNRVLSLALDTSDHAFASKSDVELWKRVKRMLPSVDTIDAKRSAGSSGRSGEVRGRHQGGNRLLLSRDDHLELEAEASAEAEEEDEFEARGEEDQGYRGGYRAQRRSRHVEQELERWVRGASS